MFSSYLEFRTMDNAQKSSDSDPLRCSGHTIVDLGGKLLIQMCLAC
jgi:hypothetical protein